MDLPLSPNGRIEKVLVPELLEDGWIGVNDVTNCAIWEEHYYYQSMWDVVVVVVVVVVSCCCGWGGLVYDHKCGLVMVANVRFNRGHCVVLCGKVLVGVVTVVAIAMKWVCCCNTMVGADGDVGRV